MQRHDTKISFEGQDIYVAGHLKEIMDSHYTDRSL
jgi:hypothetical protein